MLEVERLASSPTTIEVVKGELRHEPELQQGSAQATPTAPLPRIATEVTPPTLPRTGQAMPVPAIEHNRSAPDSTRTSYLQFRGGRLAGPASHGSSKTPATEAF